MRHVINVIIFVLKMGYPPGNICHLGKRKIIFPATFERGHAANSLDCNIGYNISFPALCWMSWNQNIAPFSSLPFSDSQLAIPAIFGSPHSVGPATHTIWSFQNTHGEALQDGTLRFHWPSKWVSRVSGVIHPISGAITLLRTGRGPLCKNHSIEHTMESTLDHLFPSWMRNKGLKHRVLVRIPFHVHDESPCEDLEKWTPKWTVSPNLWFFSFVDPTQSTRNQERILRFEKNRRHIKISTVAYA